MTRPKYPLNCKACHGQGSMKFQARCVGCGRRGAYVPISAPAEDHFWAKVIRRGPDECWEWIGARAKYNYGRWKRWGSDKWVIVSRYSYEINKGEIPPGMEVLHSCDNSLCVNPNHLSLGTHLRNMREMISRGRSGVSSLKPAQVVEIRRKIAAGGRVKDIASEYGVGPHAISHIKTGRTWGSVSQVS